MSASGWKYSFAQRPDPLSFSCRVDDDDVRRRRKVSPDDDDDNDDPNKVLSLSPDEVGMLEASLDASGCAGGGT